MAQAISSRNPTAPSSDSSTPRTGATVWLTIEVTFTPQPRGRTPSTAARSANATSSACACAGVTPGASRANTSSQRAWSLRRSPAENPSGVKRSTSSGKGERAGITPTMVKVRPFKRRVWPKAWARPPNCRCHRPWPRMTTSSPSARSSSGKKLRPSSGRAPSVGRALAVRRAARG